MSDSSAVPGPSTRLGCAERVSGTVRTASSSATAATGAFTRNIERQPVPARSMETSTPPSTWPTALATPAVPLYMLSALPRRCPLVVAWMVASTCGSISAEAAPCATRAATSVQASGARPHATEVTPNATVPQRNSRRRPIMSPSRPPRTSSTAYATPYPPTTISSIAGPACRSRSIVGSATLTIKKSIIGSAAPISTVMRPSEVRTGGAVAGSRETAGAEGADVGGVPREVVVVTRRASSASQPGTSVCLCWYWQYLATP